MLPTTKIKKNKKKHTKKNTKKPTKATLHRKIKIEQKHKTILTLQKKKKKKEEHYTESLRLRKQLNNIDTTT